MLFHYALLQAGWEIRLNEVRGRYFFIDHSESFDVMVRTLILATVLNSLDTHSTQWEDPRLATKVKHAKVFNKLYFTNYVCVSTKYC